jgi:hypothetical protein
MPPTWKPTRCNGVDCGALIVFLKRPKGPGVMPVNFDDTVQPDDTHYVAGRHVSHHATCPNAGDFRKDKRR